MTGEGERRVRVEHDARHACATTVFHRRQVWADADPPVSLLEAELRTGRTHQIRVHLTHLGFPLAGDDKYGDFAWNKALAKQGLKRMFLHAWRLSLPHPLDARRARRSSRRCRPILQRSSRASMQGTTMAQRVNAPQRFRLLVFDWDGTLVDSTGDHRRLRSSRRAATSACRCPTTRRRAS